jgi:Mrp family chromosome partitioning ATPase
MSRHTAVLEKSLGSTEQVERVVGRRIAPEPPADNAFTGLIARLFGGPEPLRVVAFTSALPREGVTYTLRRAAAELERTVGFRATVASAAELLVPAASDTHILGTPSFANNTGRRDRLAELRGAFDVVFVDAGSIATSGAVVGLAQKVDAVVVVVEAGRTSKTEVARTVETIVAAGGTIAGLVLNKRKAVLPAWLERMLG